MTKNNTIKPYPPVMMKRGNLNRHETLVYLKTIKELGHIHITNWNNYLREYKNYRKNEERTI